jgi:hypothetical protein
MKISEKQFKQLPVGLQECFKPLGGGVGVGFNAHPT